MNTPHSDRKITALAGFPRGVNLLHDPLLNKGMAFSERERDILGLRGLLPPHVHSMEEQSARIMENFERKPTDLERYIYLVNLQVRNKMLFYHVLINNLEKLMPILYTPTVGQACQEYGHIFQKPRGIFISAVDRGRIQELLKNWPYTNIRIIVVTDGERILGLGDLGANGMGIPVGKLALYSACGGIHPSLTLPVTIDTGTENRSLLEDPLYIGTRHPRIRGEEYDSLLDEFMEAAESLYPGVMIQLEDFANTNAFRLLNRYRDRYCCFDDDIQGTAVAALAGLLSSLKITGGRLTEQRLLFAGAGEAGIGIGDLTVSAMTEDGLSEEEARKRCWFMDSKGLVVHSRDDLAEHKLRFAHSGEFIPDLLSAVRKLKPTALIGVAGKAGIFTDDILKAMGDIHERPVIFALSNPTANAECTAEQAYTATGGRAVFASGSPFEPVALDGRTYIPGQANNAYVFPGIGLAAVSCGLKKLPDELFLAAARSLADSVTADELRDGRTFPALGRIREVSVNIAENLCGKAFDLGIAGEDRPGDIRALLAENVFEPEYCEYV